MLNKKIEKILKVLKGKKKMHTTNPNLYVHYGSEFKFGLDLKQVNLNLINL